MWKNALYYMEESVLLGTKPLVDSIRHFIRDPSGVFSVCHLCECRIVQWRHDSRLLLLLNWFLHIIKRTLHVGSKIWILCSLTREILFLPREHKIHIFSPPCNIPYIYSRLYYSSDITWALIGWKSVLYESIKLSRHLSIVFEWLEGNAWGI